MTSTRERYRLVALFILALSISIPLFAQSFIERDDSSALAQLGSVDNLGIGETGTVRLADLRVRTASTLLASLAGSYASSTQHPRVFTTPGEMKDLVARINSGNSFAAQNFSKLTNEIKADLAASVDWDAVYSGCDLDMYLHAFSYEPGGGYANERRTTSQMSAAMHVKPGLAAPAGAAVVASRLALYAALVRTGAHTVAGSPAPEQASALAKRILLAWANRGFRDQRGSMLRTAEQFCDDQERFTALNQSGVGLQIGRGIIYSVHAQDLLQSIAALNEKEANELNAFHGAIFNLILQASNFRFRVPELNRPDATCELYSNHVETHLIGLLSIARLLDDGHRFNAVVFGTEPSMPLAIPWVKYFDHAIYGENDRPINCHKNKGPDRLASPGSFQTPVVAPGEIEDRYRNANPSQSFGYSLGVLAGLYDTATIMKNAGFDALDYRGSHHQSIEMATEYYACYGKYVGFKKTITAENARACPDYQEYIGQIVSGVEINIVMGAYRFPRNTLFIALDEPAKAEAGRDLLDSIRFGRWRE